MGQKTVMIYSIIRNRENHIKTYHNQIKLIVKTFPNIKFLLSVYENDSTDKTKELLNTLDWSFVENNIVTEDLGTQYFGSDNGSKDRVSLLADARNKAIEAKDFLERSDYVLHVEGDVVFDINSVKLLFNFKKHEPEFDIVSSISLRNGNRHYDVWGTRRDSVEPIGKLFDGWKKRYYDKYYATSNGICLYRSEPFKMGARYGWLNKTLGHHDCEMVVVCDEFHRLGFHNIYILYKSVVFHD
jgi:hypothetical protein